MRKHKIYFACSITGEQGGKEDKKLIVEVLKNLGHEVLSEVFVNQDETNSKEDKNEPKDVYNWCIKRIKACTLVVADVTRLSLGVGYEIGWSIKSGKKVVALCKNDRFDKLTWMIKGITARNFKIFSWKDKKDLEQILLKI